MKLIFRLRFFTRFGQQLFLAGEHKMFGAGKIENALPLQFLNSDFWQATIDLPDAEIPGAKISWFYILRNPDGSTREDFGNDRATNFKTFSQNEILIVDSWNDAATTENVFATEPFKKVLLRANASENKISPLETVTHIFKVKTPPLEKNQTLCFLGNCDALGNWNTNNPPLLSRALDESFFSAPLNLRGANFPIHYKYGIFDSAQNTFLRFEDGENRILFDEIAPEKLTIVNDGFARWPAKFWRGAGVAIPVFSLRSENSFGVGEFSDLKLLADWSKRAGPKLIQILPVNDTSATGTWVDSYPYAAISAFALHPLYLNLNQMSGEKNLPPNLEVERKLLNALDAVDYEAVMREKLKFIRQIFPAQKEKTFSRADYKNFFAQNKFWLEPYAAFCFLRDKFGTADFNRWPQHRRFQPNEIEKLFSSDANARAEIELNYFIQFHLHLQLRDAAEYAHANGVILKGDIAIGVYRHGADVWQQPELFHTEMQAGAPPDAFAAKGQNWGFPTYNWPRMKQDNFAWWKKRFAQMSNYFDAFRIDHILGFFRIWSSPAHAVEGILGFFAPALPVQISEFTARGIAFDRDRFVKPFITDEILQQIFGNESEIVKQNFLNLDANGNFSLKPEFSTQQQIENYFSTLEPRNENQKLKEGLFDLISNVILLEVENSGAREFHFRFGIEDTFSFQNFDPQTQAKLKELYVDYFYRRQENFWRREGLQKLPALKRVTNMLICGEDLGMVPMCVPEVMRQLGLLSLEIQRMPKTLGAEFSRPADAPYLSVVTPGTHDMSTIRGWWEEDKNVAQKFFNRELGLPGDAPEHCSAEFNKKIVAQHLASPAMWSIFQLQDLLGLNEKLQRADFAAERINVPANPKNYWRYRMHISLEELLRADFFNDSLEISIRQNGR